MYIDYNFEICLVKYDSGERYKEGLDNFFLNFILHQSDVEKTPSTE